VLLSVSLGNGKVGGSTGDYWEKRKKYGGYLEKRKGKETTGKKGKYGDY
jgi:hypothetical protein